jgi:hypothetical protein
LYHSYDSVMRVLNLLRRRYILSVTFKVHSGAVTMKWKLGREKYSSVKRKMIENRLANGSTVSILRLAVLFAIELIELKAGILATREV